MSILYVVATPIGNMEDITLRAIRILKEADLIAAEDTRQTRKLLAHYAVSTPVTSYHEHNERNKAPLLVGMLKSGKSIALTSDAGTPGISDPGYRLVRLAAEEGIRVVAIPGPSALTAILSVAGLPTDEFTFKGFIPARAGQRRRFLTELKGTSSTFVFYESPRRLKETLISMEEILGDAEVAIGRELTKLYEEIIRGTVGSAVEAFKGREVKGEVAIVLRTKRSEPASATVAASAALEEELKWMLSSGISLKDAVKAVAKRLGVKKAVVYKEALRLKEGFPKVTFKEGPV